MRIDEAADVLLRASSEDEAAFQQAYDAALWSAVTASSDELLDFGKRLFDDPYMSLPAPLQIAILRILGLERPSDGEATETALAGIAMYCDPVEEQNATAGIVGAKKGAKKGIGAKKGKRG